MQARKLCLKHFIIQHHICQQFIGPAFSGTRGTCRVYWFVCLFGLFLFLFLSTVLAGKARRDLFVHCCLLLLSLKVCCENGLTVGSSFQVPHALMDFNQSRVKDPSFVDNVKGRRGVSWGLWGPLSPRATKGVLNWRKKKGEERGKWGQERGKGKEGDNEEKR